MNQSLPAAGGVFPASASLLRQGRLRENLPPLPARLAEATWLSMKFSLGQGMDMETQDPLWSVGRWCHHWLLSQPQQQQQQQRGKRETAAAATTTTTTATTTTTTLMKDTYVCGSHILFMYLGLWFIFRSKNDIYTHRHTHTHIYIYIYIFDRFYDISPEFI